MAIYIGGKKNKILANGVSHNVDISPSVPISNGIMLLTSDGFMLRDKNHLRTTSTDIDEYENKILSSDGIILKDKNDRYMTSGEKNNLLSFDGYILKDKNDIYIMSMDIDGYKKQLLSFDDYILKDLNEFYLTTKGE